jgi:hypothetical protein
LISLLCTLIQGRTHAVDVALPASPGMGPVSIERPGVPTTFSRLLSDMLDPQSPSAPKTAAALRDALIAFVWAERANRQGTSALGVTLSASLAATLPREDASTAVAAPAPAERPDLFQLALERADEALGAVRRRLEKVGPWARQNRGVLALAATLLIGGLVLGHLLVQLRARPAGLAATPAASAASATTAASGFGTATGSASGTPGPGTAATGAAPAGAAADAQEFTTVTFHVKPWGEIVIDDKPTGVSPPMQQTTVKVGTRLIEVRHLADAPCTNRVEAVVNVPLEIVCDFK